MRRRTREALVARVAGRGAAVAREGAGRVLRLAIGVGARDGATVARAERNETPQASSGHKAHYPKFGVSPDLKRNCRS